VRKTTECNLQAGDTGEKHEAMINWVVDSEVMSHTFDKIQRSKGAMYEL